MTDHAELTEILERAQDRWIAITEAVKALTALAALTNNSRWEPTDTDNAIRKQLADAHELRHTLHLQLLAAHDAHYDNEMEEIA